MKTKVLVTILACCIPAIGLADIYTWKDADGRTHFSDQPPPVGQVKTMRGGQRSGGNDGDATPSAPASGVPDAKASGPKSWQDQNKDFAKRQADKAEAEAKAKKEQQQKAEKEQYCSDLRRNVAMLEHGGRIGKANDKGESVPMSDSQLQSELDSNRSKLSKDCK